jgi:hypothetical protein
VRARRDRDAQGGSTGGLLSQSVDGNFLEDVVRAAGGSLRRETEGNREGAWGESELRQRDKGGG